jgi:hypothetical protein
MSGVRARAARDFANKCTQRAAMLVEEANLLLEHFDELEHRMLMKSGVQRMQWTPFSESDEQ